MERASEQKAAAPTVPVATVKPHTVNSKPRKMREQRSRSQEWPDVPDFGKTEEQNPDSHAQKIVETGRQAEVGKVVKPNVIVNGYSREPERHVRDDHRQAKAAPVHRAQPQPPRAAHAPPPAHRHSPLKPQKPLNVVTKVQESPKVINFEDRLKSIITSVLNEDQEQRKASRQPTAAHPYSNGYVRPPNAQHGYAPRAAAAPSPASGYGRVARDLRRERYAYERRPEPRTPHPAHPAHPAHPGHTPHSQHTVLEHRHHHAAQPDYTQVSPAKLALRRHLSQERLSAPGARTIGDLVNGEIERTLEISNQSIINAAVNMSARYHEPAAQHQPLEGLAACLQARVLASEYWRGRGGGAGGGGGAAGGGGGAGGGGEAEEGRRRTPPPDTHSNSSTPLADDLPEPRPPGEGGGEEVEESKWQDRIAFRFDQIISFASTAMEDKRRRSDEACNTSPDSGIGHGEPGRAPPVASCAPPGPASGPAPGAPLAACATPTPGGPGGGGEARTPSPLATHHFKKRFFRRERWGAWGGPPPPAAVDWERPAM